MYRESNEKEQRRKIVLVRKREGEKRYQFPAHAVAVTVAQLPHFYNTRVDPSTICVRGVYVYVYLCVCARATLISFCEIRVHTTPVNVSVCVCD